MSPNKKYAKLMYDYLLETLLEQKQQELYLYVLTAFHTGLRASDVLNLTWEQLSYSRFKDVLMHKSTLDADEFNLRVYDVYIRKPDKYESMLKAFKYTRSGSMFSHPNRFVLSKMLNEHTGSNIVSADIRRMSNYLFDWRDCK